MSFWQQILLNHVEGYSYDHALTLSLKKNVIILIKGELHWDCML